MRNEDLTPRLSKMNHQELLDKIRAIRQARATPVEEPKSKKKIKAQKTVEAKLTDVLADMSPEELAKFLEGKT